MRNKRILDEGEDTMTANSSNGGHMQDGTLLYESWDIQAHIPTHEPNTHRDDGKGKVHDGDSETCWCQDLPHWTTIHADVYPFEIRDTVTAAKAVYRKVRVIHVTGTIQDTP